MTEEDAWTPDELNERARTFWTKAHDAKQALAHLRAYGLPGAAHASATFDLEALVRRMEAYELLAGRVPAGKETPDTDLRALVARLGALVEALRTRHHEMLQEMGAAVDLFLPFDPGCTLESRVVQAVRECAQDRRQLLEEVQALRERVKPRKVGPECVTCGYLPCMCDQQ